MTNASTRRATIALAAILGAVTLANAQTTAPTTRPAATQPATKPAATQPTSAPVIFIPRLPDIPEPTTPKPPVPPVPPVAPVPSPDDPPKPPSTDKPPVGVFIKPVDPNTPPPATQPAIPPVIPPTTQPVAAVPPTPIETKTVGFSKWVEPDANSRCVYLSRMPEDVRRFWSSRCTVAGRALAERAARDAALAELAKHFDAMVLAPGLTVGDFLAASDQPNVSRTKFLRGAKLSALRYHVDRLVIEARVEIRPRTFGASLKGWARAHRVGRDKIAGLEAWLLQADDAPVSRVGQGKPPQSQVVGQGR